MARETFDRLAPDRQEQILAAGIRAFSRSVYGDVRTDDIARDCGISKGILFHYFGSKKEFYLCCLDTAMRRLTAETEAVSGSDFYEILFAAMNRKMALCMVQRDEMLLVNMACRDGSADIAEAKASVLQHYMPLVQKDSLKMLEQALAALGLSAGEGSIRVRGLHLYIRAVLNRCLLSYQEEPDRFFENSERIKEELKEYLDLMLYGICSREDI